MNDHTQIRFSRRQVLIGAGATVLAAGGLAAGARPVAAGPAEASKMIGELTGGTAPQSGKVTIKAPQIAENGNTVPLTVTVDSPMTADNYVKSVHVVADGNPSPGVASYHFTPAAGKAEVAMRMRMAKTQNIVAVAVMSDGSVWEGKKEVKVTIGGCGG